MSASLSPGRGLWALGFRAGGRVPPREGGTFLLGFPEGLSPS